MLGNKTGLFLSLLAALSSGPVCAQTPQFQTDQPAVTTTLNDFWTLQGLGQTTAGIKANWSALLGSSDWYEWNSLKVNWTSDAADKTALRSLLLNANITGLNAKGAQADGYVWPSNGSESWLCPSPHFDQMPRFICAVYNDYLWSRDKVFLHKMQAKIEAVMAYMANTMQGRSGLLTCPGVFTGLSNKSPNVTYMDCYREGGEVTWIEEGYYTALWAMAAMEAALDNQGQAAAYKSQARRFPAQFHAQLWNPKTHRYAGWKDSSGKLHDYGFTYLNLEALARGLGSAAEADSIFEWLDNGTAEPTLMGGHKGSTDIYQCVVAPRSNTVALADEDWDFWSVSKSLRTSSMGYGALVEDGGAMLWVNYYDVLARLKWLDANNAWRKLTALFDRVQENPLRFTESVSHPTNVYGENYLEVGPADGPENGLSGTLPLFGFMGIQPRPDGLYCMPNLPTSLLFLTSSRVTYGSSSYDIRVARGHSVAETATQKFTTKAPFNTVGVCLPGSGPSSPRVAFRLQRQNGAAWTTVATFFVMPRTPDRFEYVPVPVQPAGIYQVVLATGAGSRCLYRAAFEPVAQTGAGGITRTGAAFTAKQSFSQITVRTPGDVPLWGTLTRKLGKHWRLLDTTWAKGNYGGVLGFADQPAGIYKLQIANRAAGTYALLSSRYMVTVTNVTAPKTSLKTSMVAAGEAQRVIKGE